jgi:N4-gp56 family major capsid protein
MSTQSWTYNAPSGVYQNHALSSDIRYASIAMTKFMQFSKPVEGYGAKQGSNVTITRVSNVAVPTDDSLVELERVPEDTFSLSTQAISAVERGRAIPYTNLTKEFSFFDIENAIQRKLRDQLSLRLDQLCATAFKVGQIKGVPDGIASITFYTNGTPGETASVNLNIYHIEQTRDQLYSTYHVMPYAGEDYMCLCSTKARRSIIRDQNWEKWKTYAEPDAKYNGEIGRVEGVRFIESNNTNALSGSLGTGSVLGEAVFFGDDPVAMASVLDPELRAKESEDYGRSRGIAWYGIYGFDQIWKDSANDGEARVIHITSQ